MDGIWDYCIRSAVQKNVRKGINRAENMSCKNIGIDDCIDVVRQVAVELRMKLSCAQMFCI